MSAVRCFDRSRSVCARRLRDCRIACGDCSACRCAVSSGALGSAGWTVRGGRSTAATIGRTPCRTRVGPRYRLRSVVPAEPGSCRSYVGGRAAASRRQRRICHTRRAHRIDARELCCCRYSACERIGVDASASHGAGFKRAVCIGRRRYTTCRGAGKHLFGTISGSTRSAADSRCTGTVCTGPCCCCDPFRACFGALPDVRPGAVRIGAGTDVARCLDAGQGVADAGNAGHAGPHRYLACIGLAASTRWGAVGRRCLLPARLRAGS